MAFAKKEDVPAEIKVLEGIYGDSVSVKNIVRVGGYPHDGKYLGFDEDIFTHYNRTKEIKTPALLMQDIYLFEKGKDALTILKIKTTIQKRKYKQPDFENPAPATGLSASKSKATIKKEPIVKKSMQVQKNADGVSKMKFST